MEDQNLNAPINPPVQNTPNPIIPPYPPADSTPISVEQPQNNSVFKKIIIVVVILILAGVISVGAYFGYGYYQGSQVSISGAVINTLEAFSTGKIQSGEFSLVVEVTAKDVGKNYADLATGTASQVTSQLQDVAFNLSYSGLINKTVDNEFETSGDFSASIKNPTGGTLGMLNSQEMVIKYKTFSDNIYLNVQKLPSLVSLVVPPTIDTTKYLNNWYFVPQQMTTDAFVQGFTDNGTRNMATTTLTNDDKNRVKEILEDSGAFTIIDKKSEKTSKGTEVTAFYLKVDWDKLGDEIIKISREEAKKNNTTYLKSQELELRTNIEKFKEMPVTNSVIKILVGRDGYIHGYSSAGDLADKESKQIGSFKISLNLDSFNQKFVIERPADARSLVEMIAEINMLMNADMRLK
jgi:hypothetical protein